MTNEELLKFNQEGFIPGPHESEENFLQRVNKTKEIFLSENQIPPSHWDFVKEKLFCLFDVKPLYTTAFYSNKSLSPWEAAVTWIDGVNRIQLKEKFKTGSFLYIYNRDEILAHEAIHAIRAGFEEEKFEEFFAYLSSENKLRQILGPIFQKPIEVFPFLFLAVGSIFFSISQFGLMIYTLFGFIRLFKKRLTLKKASFQLSKWISEPKFIRAILFRLTDEEIIKLAKGLDFLKYVKSQNCLRWRLIKIAYLEKS